MTKAKREALLTGFLLGAFFIVVVIAVYGFVRWPHARLREVDGVIRDKVGAVYTAEQYREFCQWEMTLVGSFVGLLIFGPLVAWVLGLPFRWKGQSKAGERLKEPLP